MRGGVLGENERIGLPPHQQGGLGESCKLPQRWSPAAMVDTHARRTQQCGVVVQFGLDYIRNNVTQLRHHLYTVAFVAFNLHNFCAYMYANIDRKLRYAKIQPAK